MIAAALRMLAAGSVLVRYDALAPREFAELLPAPARFAASVLRLFSGPEAKAGRPGERLAHAFERLGPVAIKLGQLLSTRADIFGQQFSDDLSRLKDRLPPFPLEAARRDIEAALGRPLDTLFAKIEPAVAAASIAQAHPAILIDGRKVAVKVLRPGVEKRIAADVAAMRLGAMLVEAAAPPLRRLGPQAFLATVARSLDLELDLRLEAAGASELGEVMAGDGYMTAPAVVWEGVAKRVLTLEWADGVPLSTPEALEIEDLDRPELANRVIRAFLAQALDHGVFHADLHEGNLFVAAPARLMAVDYGIVGRLDPDARRFLAEILWGFLNRDYRRVSEVHFEAGYVPPHQDVDTFAQALRSIGEPIFGRKAKDVSMGRLLGQLFEFTELFEMKMRPELVLLQKTMVTVEGVARRIDPANDIWQAAKPVVERWIARELSPPAQARRLALRGLKLFETLETRLETPPTSAPAPVDHGRLIGFGIGLAVAALVLAAAALARLL
jgi:ubiquinone biosynthesis protein